MESKCGSDDSPFHIFTSGENGSDDARKGLAVYLLQMRPPCFFEQSMLLPGENACERKAKRKRKYIYIFTFHKIIIMDLSQ